MTWLANINVSPVTGIESVLYYVGKYATKGEKKSTSYAEILKTVLEQVSSLASTFVVWHNNNVYRSTLRGRFFL